jgi:hypothetical protein
VVVLGRRVAELEAENAPLRAEHDRLDAEVMRLWQTSVRRRGRRQAHPQLSDGDSLMGFLRGRRFNMSAGHKRSGCRPRSRTGQAPPVSAGRRASRGQATQVLSHGRHHHNRLSVVSQPSSSGLNATAGSPQNRHSDPPPARASIHPVVLAVAACIPSNLGVRFTLVLS